MTTGTPQDMIDRQRRVLPRWFPDTSPVLDTILAGFAEIGSHVWTMIEFVRLQARVKTATGGFLDLAAYDFFGLRFRRRTNEADASFRARILAEIVRPRNTRAAIIDAVTELIGQPPYLVFEPSRPADTGGYGVNGRMGYSMAGRYGSLLLPNQIFVIPILPVGPGIPSIQGYGLGEDQNIGAYGAGRIRYAQVSEVEGPVTNDDIFAAIESVRSAGCIVWVSPQTVPPESFLDLDAVLDMSVLA